MSGRPATVNVIPGRFALSVGATDMPCPPGWAWTPLEAVARLESGHTPSRNHPEYWDGDIPWIGIKDARIHHGGIITSTLQTVTQAGLDNSAARLLPRGTVCLSRTASVGYVVVMGTDMATSQDFVNWVCGPALDPHFLKLLLIAERESLLAFGKGSTHTTIYFPEVKAFHICLPPLAEQRRLVARAEAMATQSRRVGATLETVPPLLDKLRQSILTAACAGRLTSRGAFDPESIPATWHWATLDELALPGGIFDGARDHGSGTAIEQNLRTADYTESGVRVVRLENLAHLEFIEDKRTFISEGKFTGLKQNEIREGDLLFGSFIDENLRVCLFPRLPVPAIAKADCFCVRPDRTKVLPEYLLYQLACRRTRDSIASQAHGLGRLRITTRQLRAIRIPLCPLKEQEEIANQISRRLAATDRLLTIIEACSLQTEGLERAALAKAFRGELVEQDPSDEPAVVQPERIRASRSTAESGSRTRQRPRRADGLAPPEDEWGDDGYAANEKAPTPAATPAVPELAAATIRDRVFAAIWPRGPLEKDDAIHSVADHLRSANLVAFQRLRTDGPLYAQIADAIDAAVKAGHLDRPKRGHVRACKPNATAYTADDWRHALLAVLGSSPTERDEAIRAAAEWARDNCGLEFTRLRADGHIVTGLRSALNSAIRAKLITRFDATHIARAPDAPADRQTTLFADDT